MNLDHDFCYAASKSRDPRFDGRFFVAVLTTGIYCRPICPAPMPKQENVRFYISASAAREAGFRPCLRCRPEASPGTPDWQGSSALVARGMHLIDQGILDDGGVPELSSRLNIGARQLRRLFVEHLGASPLRVAQTRRLHFAKKLIDETSLPMTEVAFAAGFSSIRRFNDVIRNTYDRTPTELRSRRKKTGDGGNGWLRLTLAYRPPFDWSALLAFLQSRAIPGVEWVEENAYQRTVQLGGESGLIRVAHDAQRRQLLLGLPPNLSPHVLPISERIRSLFDLRADPMPIAEHLASDRMLRPILRRYPGLRLPGAWDPFELGVRAILGQQVSIKAANTLAGRLAQTYGEALPQPADQSLGYIFPNPEALANAALREIGLTARRAETIRAFARAALGDDSLLQTAKGLEEFVERLVRIPGIGPWTAHYIAMRGLGEPDAFPAGDLGLRRAVALGEKAALTERQLLDRSQAWRPWRAYAAIYLWKHYAAIQSGKGQP